MSDLLLNSLMINEIMPPYSVFMINSGRLTRRPHATGKERSTSLGSKHSFLHSLSASLAEVSVVKQQCCDRIIVPYHEVNTPKILLPSK